MHIRTELRRVLECHCNWPITEEPLAHSHAANCLSNGKMLHPDPNHSFLSSVNFILMLTKLPTSVPMTELRMCCEKLTFKI